jgi:DNA polymerase-3 subunit chi
MTEIAFYHLTTLPLEKALPRLLEKILHSHKRALILCASQERLTLLNETLWTVGKMSFIPHGSSTDGYGADQPIWLTMDENDNPNGAQFLIVTDGLEPSSFDSYERCLDLFDGNDEAAVSLARKRWKIYKEKGFPLTYWKQTESGSWEKGLK